MFLVFVQAPLYPSVSEDLTEEKIHWEPIDEMEFDEEIHLVGNRSSILGDVIAKRAASEKRKAKLTVSNRLRDTFSFIGNLS